MISEAMNLFAKPKTHVEDQEHSLFLEFFPLNAAMPFFAKENI